MILKELDLNIYIYILLIICIIIYFKYFLFWEKLDFIKRENNLKQLKGL